MGLYGLKRLVCIPMLSISFIKYGGMAFMLPKSSYMILTTTPCFTFSLSYIKYLIKHNATADYEILHKDKLFKLTLNLLK